MPRYDYECPRCAHVREVEHRMTKSPRITCADCRCAMVRLPCVGAALQPPRDSGWEYENDGKGRLCNQLGNAKQLHAYCRSRQEFRDKAERRGWRVENA